MSQYMIIGIYISGLISFIYGFIKKKIKIKNKYSHVYIYWVSLKKL